MKRFSRKLLLLLTSTLLLLSACTTSQSGNSTPPVSATTPTATTITNHYPAKTAADICPAPLNAIDTCLTPHAMRLAYGVQSLIDKGYTGKGQTIVDMVSFGSPTLQQDMDVFDRAYGLPAIDLQVISPINEPENDPHNDKRGWAEETELDVEVIHAIAPEAKVIVLTSPVAETEGTFGLPEYRQLEQYIIDHQLGNIVSQSWGASEISLDNDQGKQEIHRVGQYIPERHHTTWHYLFLIFRR